MPVCPGRGGPVPSPAIETTEAVSERNEYLTRQLITCLGNKRALLPFIGDGIKKIQKKLNKSKLKMFDVFSGSGIVARFFRQFSELLIANDLEKYSAIINECYLSNEDELDIFLLRNYYREITGEADNHLIRGIIAELYAPQDDKNIKPDERVFYTARNAMYIDTVRQLTGAVPAKYQKYFLAPLLSEASIHANTSGVFKGFYKNRETGIGQFGGIHQDALFRITGDIRLPFPVFSNFSCDTIIRNGDANKIIQTLPEVDVAYLDPPYNQHPYGSNYFMLNIILDYRRPENTSKVSGIPENWNRSDYNRERHALPALTELVEQIKAKYVIISFNSEGFIGIEHMKHMLASIGRVEVLETTYHTFRGARNLKTRDIHLKEYLYLLEK
ncbi:MAG: DNA adenine methylase [Spirochaetaceae bacterium]|jgi:adenine-specific DNA-methyltransferase|nr:DNA adenine methylase [Spirochaetaceae bacterium]